MYLTADESICIYHLGYLCQVPGKAWIVYWKGVITNVTILINKNKVDKLYTYQNFINYYMDIYISVLIESVQFYTLNRNGLVAYILVQVFEFVYGGI